MYCRLDTLSLLFASLLEKYGYQALPIYGCMPLGINSKGIVVGIINQILMAEAAKIGVIGKNDLLIHPRYGARLMLGSLLTVANLPEMHDPDVQTPDCPTDCRICADACPVNAIIPERKKVYIMRCLKHTAKTPAMSRLKFFYLILRNKLDAARYISITSFNEHTFHNCSLCVSLCPYGSV